MNARIGENKIKHREKSECDFVFCFYWKTVRYSKIFFLFKSILWWKKRKKIFFVNFSLFLKNQKIIDFQIFFQHFEKFSIRYLIFNIKKSINQLKKIECVVCTQGSTIISGELKKTQIQRQNSMFTCRAVIAIKSQSLSWCI